jgi:hypothetical protein
MEGGSLGKGGRGVDDEGLGCLLLGVRTDENAVSENIGRLRLNVQEATKFMGDTCNTSVRWVYSE